MEHEWTFGHGWVGGWVDVYVYSIGCDGHLLVICFERIIFIIKHLPKFPSLLLSNCITVRWMLPFGLIAADEVLNFFLRWISSIFHGGRSKCKCELGVTVVLDDEAMVRLPSLWFFFRLLCFSILILIDANIKLRFNIYRNYYCWRFHRLICRECAILFTTLLTHIYSGLFFRNWYVHTRSHWHPYDFIPLSITVCFSGVFCFILFFLLPFFLSFFCSSVMWIQTDRIKHKTHTNAGIYTISINCTYKHGIYRLQNIWMQRIVPFQAAAKT